MMIALMTGKCSWECPHKSKEGYCSIPDRCIRLSEGTSILYETRKPKEPKKDLVEVVRCKDCKWWTKQEASLQGRCDAYGMYPTGEWYCARGEGKENETD